MDLTLGCLKSMVGMLDHLNRAFMVGMYLFTEECLSPLKTRNLQKKHGPNCHISDREIHSDELIIRFKALTYT